MLEYIDVARNTETVRDPEHRPNLEYTSEKIKSLSGIASVLELLLSHIQNKSTTTENSQSIFDTAEDRVNNLLSDLVEIRSDDESFTKFTGLVNGLFDDLKKIVDYIHDTPQLDAKIISSVVSTVFVTFFSTLSTRLRESGSAVLQDETLANILSTKKNITFQGQQVSQVELLGFNLGNHIRNFDALTQYAQDESLKSEAVILEEFDAWVLEQDKNSSIFLTPYTESVLQAMEEAHAVRNGLLKFVLHGDAGVGKTRLAEEFARRMGKKVMVISFHYFIGYEDLVASTAVSVDGVDSSRNPLNKSERFGKMFTIFSELSPEEFWVRMENAYTHSGKKYQFESVEDFVRAQTGITTVDSDSDANPREQLREDYLKSLAIQRDAALFEDADENVKYYYASILQANADPDMVVLIDEIDKAGPQAIDSILTLMSKSPGESWTTQAGEVQLRDDFFLMATSNAQAPEAGNSATQTNEQGINKFLVDRTQQIDVLAQPVKDTLMMMAIYLSDEKGKLLISDQEQAQLVVFVTEFLPKLRKMEMNVPITNRVIKTICSRLVNYQKDVTFNTTSLKRVTSPSGEPVSVFEALKLSLLDMKAVAMTRSERNKVEQLLKDFFAEVASDSAQNLSRDYVISQAGDQFAQRGRLDISQLFQRAAESQPNQEETNPLKYFAALLDSEAATLHPVTEVKVVDEVFVDPSLRNMLTVAARSTQAVETKVVAHNPSIEFTVNGNGVTKEIVAPDRPAQIMSYEIASQHKAGYTLDYSEAKIMSSSADGTVLVLAGVKKNTLTDSAAAKNVTVILDSKKNLPISTEDVENGVDTKLYVDANGKYKISLTGDTLSIESLNQKKDPDIYQGVGSVVLQDISPSGNTLLCRDDSSLFVVTVDRTADGIGRSRKITVSDDVSNAREYSFVGENMLVSKNNSQPIYVVR